MAECKAWHNVKLLWRWLFQMGSHYRHGSANTWSAVTDSFMWGVSAHLRVHLVWKLDLILPTILNGLSLKTNQPILDLLSLTVSCGGSAHLRVHLVWKYELISGLTLASQRSFLRKTNKVPSVICYTVILCSIRNMFHRSCNSCSLGYKHFSYKHV